MGEVSAYLNAQQKELADVELTPEGLAGLVKLIEKGTISSKIAKKVFKELIEKGGDAEKIVKEKALCKSLTKRRSESLSQKRSTTIRNQSKTLKTEKTARSASLSAKS